MPLSSPVMTDIGLKRPRASRRRRRRDKALLFDIHSLSTHDGPGLRTVFFFKGCSLKCEWCQNPESIGLKNQVWHNPVHCLGCGICMEVCPLDAVHPHPERNIAIDYDVCTSCGLCTTTCPGQALKMLAQSYTLDDLLYIVRRDKPFFTKKVGGGVTVSGGEALLQADFVTELFKGCQTMGVHTAIDTCGQVPWESIEQVLPYTNLFLYDLKLIDREAHKHFTGTDNRTILSNLLRLSAAIRRDYPETRIWIRTPLIPGATLSKGNLADIGEFLDDMLPDMIERWELCSFNPLPDEKYDRLSLTWKYKGIPMMTQDEGELALSWARSHFSAPEKVIRTGLTAKA